MIFHQVCLSLCTIKNFGFQVVCSLCEVPNFAVATPAAPQKTGLAQSNLDQDDEGDMP